LQGFLKKILAATRTLAVPNLYKLHAELLSDGKITADEVDTIKAHIEQDGQLDYDDVTFLVNLLADAKDVCPEFDALFFPTLRQVLLEDGRIGLDEQYQLMKMIYSDGSVRECERDFLRDLCDTADEVTPEFKQLCETALNCPETDWDVGGTPRQGS
jgi:uncharacterized tellurite resistance protein B-like protein